MQVSTSYSGRFAGAAKRTPLVAIDRHVKGRREIDERLVVRLLVAEQVPLHLDADVVRAKRADDAIDEAAHAKARSAERRAADQCHEASDCPSSSSMRQRSFPLRRAQFHSRHEPAQVPVAFARFDEHGQPEHRAAVPIAIVNSAPMIALIPARWRRDGSAGRRRRRRDRAARAPVPELGGAIDERFRQRCAVEK